MLVARMLVHHHDWAIGVGDAVLADRTEQHAGELPVTPAPDDKKVRCPRCFFQHQGWVTLSDERSDGYGRVGVSHRPQSLVQYLLSASCRVVVLRER
jgi:hypothetical protein